MDLMWACDDPDHIEHMAVMVYQRGFSTEDHIFEVSRTCRATAESGRMCGAAGDYLVVRTDGRAVFTVCERHMREWAPPKERADWW